MQEGNIKWYPILGKRVKIQRSASTQCKRLCKNECKKAKKNNYGNQLWETAGKNCKEGIQNLYTFSTKS